MRFLYHLLPGESARSSSGVRPAGQDPFIHLCRFDQLAAVRSRYFPGGPAVALIIDPTALDPKKLREEDSYGHGSFPHYYGEIPPQAILGRLAL
jgi:uncharacterized protein (DUF952 family)